MGSRRLTRLNAGLNIKAENGLSWGNLKKTPTRQKLLSTETTDPIVKSESRLRVRKPLLGPEKDDLPSRNLRSSQKEWKATVSPESPVTVTQKFRSVETPKSAAKTRTKRIERKVYFDAESVSPLIEEKATRTPRSSKVLKPKVPVAKVTPSPKKKLSTKRFPKTAKPNSVFYVSGKEGFERFREQLSSRLAPAVLPCRDEQFETIYRFIDNNLKTQTSRTLYISGVPGTGKTATARKVVEEVKNENRNNVDFVEVNGMRLADPNQVYSEIYRQLIEDRKVSAATALQKLNSLFTEEDIGNRSTVLLIDELDLLCTRRQNVLYQLFEWATREEAKLTILAIANTLDLPERLLSHRVSSRMGMSRLPFQPYTHQEIEEILSCRLEGCDCVESDAVELVSRKVAAVSGDLRKALEICRRAVDVALERNVDQLSINEVQTAVSDLANKSSSGAVTLCSLHEKKVLAGAVAEYQRTGNEEIAFSRLIHAYEDSCRVQGNAVNPLSAEELMAVCAALSNTALLISCPGLSDWTRKYRLGMPVDEMMLALSADSFMEV